MACAATAFFLVTGGARRLRPLILAVRRSSASACLSPPRLNTDANTSEPSPPRSFFPKRGQTLELVCETLAFKGKGLCKTSDTGFVLMCDGALPGERFIGRVSRKKGSYAEVTKLKTITPHWDAVDAPCEYAKDCGGCKTQNLLYEAQLKTKDQQVRDLIVLVGRFSDSGSEHSPVLKPIVPCDVRFHYRNKMEFSFGNRRWVSRDAMTGEVGVEEDGYALGLHVPGFFDKVLNVDKCLLQSEAANKLFKIVGETRI